jgi:hypothetical protein
MTVAAASFFATRHGAAMSAAIRRQAYMRCTRFQPLRVNCMRDFLNNLRRRFAGANRPAASARPHDFVLRHQIECGPFNTRRHRFFDI